MTGSPQAREDESSVLLERLIIVVASPAAPRVGDGSRVVVSDRSGG